MNKLILIIFLVIVSNSYGGFFEFHGSFSADNEYTFHSGDPIEREPFYWLYSLKPIVTLGSVDLAFKFNISSYNSGLRQPFNRYMLMIPSLGIDLQWLKVDLFDASPSYTPYTLSGHNIRGGSLELEPGWFRFSATAGQVQRGVCGSDSTEAVYNRMLYAGKIGMENENGSCLNLNFVRAEDDSSSILPFFQVFTEGSDADTVEISHPIENTVASLDGKLNLFDSDLSLYAEISGSAYNRDNRAAELTSTGSYKIPSFIFTPRLTSQFGYAGKVGGNISLGFTQMGFDFEQVDWGFESVGASFVPQDTRTYACDFSQMLYEPTTMSFSMSFEYSRDNLSDMQLVTTIFRSGNINVGLYPNDIPSLSIGYSPFSCTAPGDPGGLSEPIKDVTHNIYGSTDYNFDLGDRIQNVNLYLSYFATDDKITSENIYSGIDMSLGGYHEVTDVLSLDWNAGRSRTESTDTTTSYAYDFGTSYEFLENVMSSSLKMSFETTAGVSENKFNLGLSNNVDLLENIPIDIFCQYTIYNGNNNNEDYEEFLIGCGSSYNW